MTAPYAPQVGGVPVRREDHAGAACWIYGEGRTRIVFLHGLRGDHHGLEPIVAHLPDVEVVVPDLPGFGASPPLPTGRHDVAGYAAWTGSLLAEVGADVLAGHSFGSVIATAAAAGPCGIGGAQLTKLVLVNPIACSAVAGPRQGMTQLTVGFHRLAGRLPERAGTALLRRPLVTRIASVAMVTTSDRDLRRWIHAEHGRYFSGFADRRVLLEAFGASIGHDVGEFAGGVSVPTLLVAADRDDIAPLPTQRALLARFPDARLAVVWDTGHLAHYEAPAGVAGAIAAFLP